MEKSNVILIGMPGCGKSTVGVILAKILGYEFVDTDLLIQKKEEARLEEIIRRVGNEAFLEIEADVCSSLNTRRTVIATGGSAVYSSRAMHHLKETGVVLYLKVSLEELSLRLHDLKARGVILPEGAALPELYEERAELYEKYADLVIEEGSGGLEETAARAIEALAQ